MIALHATVQTGSLWLSWSLDPLAWIGIPLVAFLYARGLHNLRPRLRYHGTWRPWTFYSGLALVFLTLVSPLDRLADELFLAHMTQHILLMMIGVPLVLLGAPLVPVMRGIPRPVRRAIVIPIVKSLPVRAFLRTVTNPIVALGLFVGVFTVWHFPVFFEAAVESDGLHVVQHLIFAAVAYAYWWNVIDPVPLKPNIGYLARIPYTFIVVVPNFALSAFLTFSASAWYSHYEIPAATHGFTAIQDQQLGGLIMWIPGSFIIGTAMLWVLYLALRSEQRHQLEREAAEEA